jgi:hypothetical protein
VAADGSSFVVAMLRLYARCESMVVELFAKNLNFQKALRAAFQSVVNEDASKKVSSERGSSRLCVRLKESAAYFAVAAAAASAAAPVDTTALPPVSS